MDDVEEGHDIPPNAQNSDDVALPVDAAERKRVLNILAQRRYRRRRRERQVALETLVTHSGVKITRDQSNSQLATTNTPPSASSTTDTTSPMPNGSGVAVDLGWPTPNDPLWLSETDMFQTDISSSTTSWTSSEEASLELNEFLQTDDIVNATFADDFQIAVPELDLLRAAFEIADRMQSARLLFDMTAQSIFLTSDCSTWITSLPKNLQPTVLQLTVPHHPIVDILPWPAVRNKLISMYNLPSDLWPKHPSDGSESSLIRMVYDMEDGGVRVTGADPSKEGSWEVEQRFFDAWWWALDQSVVSMSNKKRVARGVPRLCAG